MPVYMESERLWYRAPERTDAPFFTAALQDPRVRLNLGMGRYPFNEEGEAKWIEQQSKPPVMDGATDVVLAFGVKGGEILGSTGLHRISMLHRSCEWGIFIGRPDEWGKGYGREVAKATLRYAFNTLNLHRVQLRVNVTNEAGVKAYRAAGFVDEGCLRQSMFVEGAWVDVLVMAALRDEWLADRA